MQRGPGQVDGVGRQLRRQREQKKLSFKRALLIAIAGLTVGLLLGTVIRAFGANLVYTVKRGDTLSGIAHKELRDVRKWKDLAKWNELKVEWKNKVAYVWIKPGQEIQLYDPGIPRTPEEIDGYYDKTQEVMEQEIFRMAAIRDPFPKAHAESIATITKATPWIYPGDPHLSLRHVVEDLRWSINYLDHQSRYLMVQEIIDKVAVEDRFPFDTNSDPGKPWEDHRKMSFLLLALLDVESNGYFVKGKNGERGPWQIKLRTYAAVNRINWRDTYELHKIDRILMTSSQKGLDTAYDILMQKPASMRSALEHYNRSTNLNKRRAYASLVLQSYAKMVRKANAKES